MMAGEMADAASDAWSAEWCAALDALADRLDAQDQLLDAAERGLVDPDAVLALGEFRPARDLPPLPPALVDRAAMLHARCVLATRRAEELVRTRPAPRAQRRRPAVRTLPTHVDMRA